MRADSKQFGGSLQGARGLQHHAPGFIVGKTLGQVIKQVRRAFHTDQVDDLKASGG